MAVELRSVSKAYRLGESVGQSTLREAIAERVARRRRKTHQFWALRDLDLTVNTGEAVGIIGSNGAGKTTLLRLVAGITRPTHGVVRTRGRVAALIEVGTGFHPELTGRENVFLVGGLFGLSKSDLRARMASIVEFADIGPFLDTPVKRYSSGMFLRLAFAVAAHLEPDVLLVDEVLAVGDAEFQERCLGRLGAVQGEGRTVVFVSHDLGAVARLCDRAIWLDEGRIKSEGAAPEVSNQYLSSLAEADGFAAGHHAGGPVALGGVEVVEDGVATTRPRRDRPIRVCVSFELDTPVSALDLAVYLTNTRGQRVLDQSLSEDIRPPSLGPGQHRAEVSFPPVLCPGDYVLGLWIGTQYEDYILRDVGRLTVLPAPADRQFDIQKARFARPSVEWTIR